MRQNRASHPRPLRKRKFANNKSMYLLLYPIFIEPSTNQLSFLLGDSWIPSRWGSFGAWWQQVPSADWAAHTGANGWPQGEGPPPLPHVKTRRKSMGFAGFCPTNRSDANWQTSNWREFEAHLGCQGYDIQHSHPEFPELTCGVVSRFKKYES